MIPCTSADSRSSTLHLANEVETLAFGGRLQAILRDGALITLSGPLGAGKTTLVRGLLRGTGYQGPVKSPTFTLVEVYENPIRPIYHFDLYRVTDPEELEWMGFRDYLRPEALCLVEWPEKGEGFLPIPDLAITLRNDQAGRLIQLVSYTAKGNAILERIR